MLLVLLRAWDRKKNEGRGGIEPKTFRTPTHYQLQAGTQILFLSLRPSQSK